MKILDILRGSKYIEPKGYIVKETLKSGEVITHRYTKETLPFPSRQAACDYISQVSIPTHQSFTIETND